MNTTATASVAIAVGGALCIAFTLVRGIQRRWRDGRGLSIDLLTDMRRLGWPQDAGRGLMVLNVMNKGDRPFIIARISLHYFGSRWDYWRRRPRVSAVVAQANPEHSVPHILQPMKTWATFLERDQEIDAMSAAGYLCVGLTLSQSPEPILRRVILPKSY